MGWELITPNSLAELDSAQDTKLGGVEEGATDGATWGNNVGGRPTELTDGRVGTGLNNSGVIQTTVPVARGGTSQTSTDTFLNNEIGISTTGSSITINRGSTYGSTAISNLGQGLVGLSGVANNADQTSSNTSYDTARVNSTSAATVSSGAGRANTGLNSEGLVQIMVPTGYGGTGTTTTSNFLNSDLGVNLTDGTLTLTRTSGNATANVPTTLRNSQITTNANGTLNYDGTTAATPSVASIGGILPEDRGGTGLTSAGNAIVNSRITTNANGTLNYDGTTAATPSVASIGGILPENRGGTGLTSAGNAIVNSRIQMNTNGSLTYNNNGSGNPTMNTLSDANNIRSRITTGLTSSGIVATTVPTAKGGTGTTNTSDFLNSSVTTSSINSGNTSHNWTFFSGTEYSPSGLTQTVVIDWKNGAGTLVGQCTIVSELNDDDQNLDITRTSNSGSISFSGSGGTADQITSTTKCTKNGITVTVYHNITDISGWDFK